VTYGLLNSGNSDDLGWTSGSLTYCRPFHVWFLQCNAMLARYMLSSCVCPSVRPSVTYRYYHIPVLYQNG